MHFGSRLIVAVLAGLLSSQTLAHAQIPNARHGQGGVPLPPGGEPYGESYGEWAVAWWTWVVHVPSPENPVLDTTGENCAVGQRGHVWFLAGSFGTSPVVRNCTIPAGRALFFPVVNIAYFGFPTDPPITVEEITAGLAPIEQSTGLEVFVDGVRVHDVSRYLVTSPLFSVVAPEGNVFGVPAGWLLYPCMDEGYYLMLTPLAPGKHSLVIRGTSPFSIEDVTYHLEVRADH
jgi:hypothetical protein